MRKYCDEVEDMQPGDFLLYQFGRCISHGAVYVGKGRVIHAYIDRGVVMTDLSDVMFLTRKAGADCVEFIDFEYEKSPVRGS